MSDAPSAANPQRKKIQSDAIEDKAVRLYAEHFLLPMIYRWRGFWVAVAFFILAILEGIALIVLLPLKQNIPYIVQVEQATGRVVVDPQALGVFHPKLQNIAYFIRVWASRLLRVDEHSLSEALPRVAAWLQGSAVNEYKSFLQLSNPAELLADQPGFRRSIEVQATNWLHGNHACLLELTSIDTIDGVEKKRKRLLLTVEYRLIPTDGVPIDQDNPIGLVITHFSLSDLQ